MIKQESHNQFENTLKSYIVKVGLEEVIMIYELAFNGSIIRINVYAFEDIKKSFPRQILLNYVLFMEQPIVLQAKREQIVKQEFKLSTLLNTDSFNYDFHLKEVY